MIAPSWFPTNNAELRLAVARMELSEIISSSEIIRSRDCPESVTNSAKSASTLCKSGQNKIGVCGNAHLPQQLLRSSDPAAFRDRFRRSVADPQVRRQ